MKRMLLSSIVGVTLALSSLGGIVQAAPAQTASIVVERRGPGGKHDQIGQHALTATLIRATAKETGMTVSDVTAQLKAGKSLAQVAQSKGKAADAIIASVRAALKQRLDKAVANKRITQERADQALATFDSSATAMMNDTTIGQKLSQNQDRREKAAAMHILIQATSDVTGLTPKEIGAQLKAGKSLAQIAQSKGKTAADILAKAKVIVDARQQNVLANAADLVNQAGPVDTTP